METKHIAPKEQVKHIGSDMQFKHTGSKGRRTHNNTVANPDHGRWNFLKTHGLKLKLNLSVSLGFNY
eukprot:418455-Amorphochlora_amoeboformis.AAC.1